MEIYVIALLVILFFGYKVYREANSIHNRLLNGSPSVSDYTDVLYRMTMSFFSGVLTDLTKGKSTGASISNKKKKRSGRTTNHGGIKIKGGLLPKKGNIGRIEVHFDGSFPKHTKTTSGIKYFETDGNIQVIYKHYDDEVKIKFLGNSVDIYRSSY